MNSRRDNISSTPSLAPLAPLASEPLPALQLPLDFLPRAHDGPHLSLRGERELIVDVHVRPADIVTVVQSNNSTPNQAETVTEE